ncbi:signal peptidase I [Sporosarcina ureilytica]|uniref:Signal peptidase I n=1 Tax=Sporosarcina ureilytica TaxID=298596 RepID=A0A1D8JEA4_9BACL|nr:signal peptidase I [Sporosarcina ureilytica]
MVERHLSEGTKKEILSWMKSAAIALVLAILIRQFLYTPVTVSGQSMEPTFENDNRVVITKIHSINRFDMIVFHSPISDENFIKRVIGLPGDIVVMKDDHLYVNGIEYEEKYVQANKDKLYEGHRLTENFEVRVPTGHYFVLGDNRQYSMDSRMLGPIEEQAIIGKVSFRIYPLSSIGIPR